MSTPTLAFKQLRNMDGSISTSQIQMTDEQGVIWTVPLGVGHRFEQAYDDWTAAGNTITPADPASVTTGETPS